jgi:AhpD family alkylhydroperoxidase
MVDWKQTLREDGARLRELATRTPDTLKGAALMAGAGAKTNHLDASTRELIALAVAVTTRCDGCIAYHASQAVKLGVSDDAIAEALGVAIDLNAGAAMVYSAHVLDAVDRLKNSET